jgi:hypothetical protein
MKPMPPRRTFDYALPYDLMAGYWAGIATVYDDKGVYQDSIQSRAAIYWHPHKKLLHFRQDEEDSVEALLNDPKYAKHDVAAVRSFVHLNVDFAVKGKASSGEDRKSGALVTGVETRPGIYLFHLRTRDEHGHFYADYYNNQYFVDANERHIIGPCIMAPSATPAARKRFSMAQKAGDAPGYFPPGTIKFVIAQVFTRISYEVPEELKDRHGRKR